MQAGASGSTFLDVWNSCCSPEPQVGTGTETQTLSLCSHQTVLTVLPSRGAGTKPAGTWLAQAWNAMDVPWAVRDGACGASHVVPNGWECQLKPGEADAPLLPCPASRRIQGSRWLFLAPHPTIKPLCTVQIKPNYLVPSPS